MPGDETEDSTIRTGEVRLGFDPAFAAADAGLVYIGRVRSPWTERRQCPKNMRAAREAGQPASIEIAEPYREALTGLETFSHLAVLTWFDRARRDLLMQWPGHADGPRGTFSLRSPVRPNPIGLHVVRIVDIDAAGGIIRLEAIDALDATPVVDLKPYWPSVDAVADATAGRDSRAT